MKIIKYKSFEDLEVAAFFNCKEFDMHTTDVSVSFRIYYKNGNTKEFHVFYK